MRLFLRCLSECFVDPKSELLLSVSFSTQELPGTLLNGLERGIVSFEPQRRLQPEADDEVGV